jgi:hypothetical protein
MKKTALFLAIVTAAGLCMNTKANLLAYEGFDGGAWENQSVTAVGVTGSGFNTYTNTSNLMRIRKSGSLGYTDGAGHILETFGNRVGADYATYNRNLQLALSAPIVNSGTVYMSYLVNLTSLNASGWQFAAGLQNSFVAKDGGNGAVQESVLRLDANNKWVAYAAESDGGPAPSAVTTGQTYFVVAELQMDDPKSYKVYLNPTDLTDVAATAETTLSVGTANLDGWADMNGFLFGLGNQLEGEIDEIRIGTTLADVTPYTVPPAYLVEYNMTKNPAGTRIPALAQNGTDSGHFGGNDTPTIETDGTNLVFQNVDAYRSIQHSLDETHTNGQYVMEYRVPEWDMSSVSNKCGIKIGLKNPVGNKVFLIEFLTDSARNGMKANAFAQGGAAGSTAIDEIPYTSNGTGIVLRTEFDLDAQTFSAYWKWDTDADFALLTSGSLGLVGQFDASRIITVASDAWGASQFIKVGYITLGDATQAAPTTPEGMYSQWTEGYTGMGALTNLTDDAEADGMDNLLEYALGADPVSDDASVFLPIFTTSKDGDTNYLNLVYRRRTDAAERNLDYAVYSTLDLAAGPMTNATEEAGSTDLGDGFESVTNRVPTDTENNQFLGLEVEFQQ